MTIEECLNVVTKFIKNGWLITYDIHNQFENGYQNGVLAGNIAAYTITCCVSYPGQEDDCIEVFSASFDSLTEMYEWLGPKLSKIQ